MSRNFREHLNTYDRSIATLSKNELYCYVYYIFELSKKCPMTVLFKDATVFNLLFEIIRNLRIEDHFSKVLKLYQRYLLNTGKLHLIDRENENVSAIEMCFEKDNNEKFSYKEDYKIDKNCDLSSSDDKHGIELYRCIYCGPSNSFTSILWNTFFSESFEIGTENKFKVSIKYFQYFTAIQKQFDFIKQELNLSKMETEYLILRYHKMTFYGLEDVFSIMCPDVKSRYLKLLKISSKEYEYMLRPDQKLKRFYLISHNRDLAINPSLIECIDNQDFSLYFSSTTTTLEKFSTYSLDSFSIPQETTNVFIQMLNSKNPVSLLLYGKPGSGKTEYAKALVKATGKKAVLFRNESELEKDDFALGQINILLSLKSPDTVYIFDEADTILKTRTNSIIGSEITKTKGIVNKMLESAINKSIWVTNHTEQMDTSTLRRFTMSYKFETMSPQMLNTIARNKLSILNISDAVREKILEKLNQYHITGSSIDNIAKAIDSIQTDDEQELLQNIDIVLNQNSLLINGSTNIQRKVTKNYDVSILNTSISAQTIVEMIKNAVTFSEKNQNMQNPSNGIRMLFYGLSGTGKTEFARYISETLDRKLLLKRASDILDRYVGGTEENIAEAFAEAAANNEILLFDEADSFFSDRKNAEHNWELTKVNEFLTQMEEFPGILICTTNLKRIMDSAMIRRFHITVEFNALKKEGIEKLLQKYFSFYNFNEKQINKITSYNSITPGDFGRLSDTIRFMNSDIIDADYIISELCHIQEEKQEDNKKQIGFIN